jgi:hypothetical protein
MPRPCVKISTEYIPELSLILWLRLPIFLAAQLHRFRGKDFIMHDLLIGLAYVAMIVSPAILASFQHAKSHKGDF